MVLQFEENCGPLKKAYKDPDFALHATAVPLGIGEFMPAIRHYPIVFADTAPMAVLGLRQGSSFAPNDHSAWKAGHYQPGYVRRFPFEINETPDQNATVLALDGRSKRFVRRTDSWMAERSATDLYHEFHEDHLKTVEFLQAIEDAKLLVPGRCEMHFADESRYRLDGIRIVDEKAWRALPSPTVARWHSKGWLDLISLHLASQRNWQLLLDVHASRNRKIKLSQVPAEKAQAYA
jgi:SapC